MATPTMQAVSKTVVSRFLAGDYDAVGGTAAASNDLAELYAGAPVADDRAHIEPGPDGRRFKTQFVEPLDDVRANYLAGVLPDYDAATSALNSRLEKLEETHRLTHSLSATNPSLSVDTGSPYIGLAHAVETPAPNESRISFDDRFTAGVAPSIRGNEHQNADRDRRINESVNRRDRALHSTPGPDHTVTPAVTPAVATAAVAAERRRRATAAVAAERRRRATAAVAAERRRREVQQQPQGNTPGASRTTSEPLADVNNQLIDGSTGVPVVPPASRAMRSALGLDSTPGAVAAGPGVGTGGARSRATDIAGSLISRAAKFTGKTLRSQLTDGPATDQPQNERGDDGITM